ncbi:MAG: DNA internalization-related competence protein ComEC/Rec2 [Vallitalea sp.]|nr:DNA internalization-related competence protein ComEC/Rec2 [Vallitalea sp.]
MCCFYLIGLLIGYYINNFIIITWLLISTIIISVILYKTYSWKLLLLFPLICFFAYLNICDEIDSISYCSMSKNFEDTVSSKVNGYITDIIFCHSDAMQFIINTDKVTFNDKTYTESINVKVYSKAYENDLHEINIGDYISVRGTLSKLSRPKNQGQFNEEKYYRVKGISYKLFLDNSISKDNKLQSPRNNFYKTTVYSIRNILYKLRLRAISIYDNILPKDKANLMKAMILGEKSYLTIDTKEKYSDAGISHVLAISGLHITIFAFTLFKFLSYIFSRKKSVVLSICFLIFYCLLTGSSISTVRATMMVIVILLSYIFGRAYDIYSSISVVAIILLVINPFFLWDIGFLLSFSSVISIVLLTPIFDKIYNKKDNYIISMFNASLSATIGIMPVVVYNFYEVHIYAVLVNILVVPLMSIIVLFGFIALIIGSVSTIIGGIFSGIVFYILSFYDLCCELSRKLPLSTINVGRPNLTNIILYIALLYLIIQLGNENRDKRIIKNCVITIIIITIINITMIILPKPLEIVHLDIGQGDSTVIMSPNNKVYVIDGGGNVNSKTIRDTGYYIIRPFLKYNGVNKIDCLILTHSDKDHIGGLIELIDHFKVDKIIMPCVYRDKDVLLNKLILKANNKNIPLYYLDEGDRINDGNITFESLYPSSDIDEFHNNNAHSLVLKLKYKLYDILLTGDIEKQEEQYINSKYSNYMQCDILKVPHHGSSSSSTQQFINNVKPQIAVISCGKNNSYGHPNKEVVNRYRDKKILIFNTSIDGAITIKTDGYNYGISTYYSNRQEFLKCYDREIID